MDDPPIRNWLFSFTDEYGRLILREFRTIGATTPEAALHQFVHGWPAEELARSRFQVKAIPDEQFDKRYRMQYETNVEVEECP